MMPDDGLPPVDLSRPDDEPEEPATEDGLSANLPWIDIPGAPGDGQPAAGLDAAAPLQGTGPTASDEFLDPGLPALPPLPERPPIGPGEGDVMPEAASGPAAKPSADPGPGAPDEAPQEALPAQDGPPTAGDGQRVPAAEPEPPVPAAPTAAPQPSEPGDEPAADTDAPGDGTAEPAQGEAPAAARETLFSRSNPPGFLALLLPTALVFTPPYLALAVIWQVLQPRLAWPVALISGLCAALLWVLAYQAVQMALQFVPGWPMEALNAVSRRTGIARLDRSGFGAAIALAIAGAFVSPWVAWLCVAAAAGFFGSTRQPVVLWPVGWQPAMPIEARAEAIADDSVTRCDYTWALERGLGARKRVERSLTVLVDVARLENTAAENRAADVELDWKRRADRLIVQGSSTEVARVALELYRMREELQLTDYECAANVLGFIHQFDDDATDLGYWRSPLETLQAQRGSSIDLSLLTAALLRQMGWPSALLYDAGSVHMAVGIAGAAGFPRADLTSVTVNDSEYFYCEVTGKSWLPGQIPTGVDPEQYVPYATPPLQLDELRPARGLAPSSEPGPVVPPPPDETTPPPAA